MALERPSLFLLLIQTPTKVLYGLLIGLPLALAIFSFVTKLVLDQLQPRLHDADLNLRRRKVILTCSNGRFYTPKGGFQNGNVVLFGERPPKL